MAAESWSEYMERCRSFEREFCDCPDCFVALRQIRMAEYMSSLAERQRERAEKAKD